MKEMRGVHALIHIALLDINVPIEMNDAKVAIDERGYTADVRIRDRVVASDYYREGTFLEDVMHSTVDRSKVFSIFEGMTKMSPASHSVSSSSRSTPRSRE